MFAAGLVPLIHRVRRDNGGGAAGTRGSHRREKTLEGLGPGPLRTEVVARMLTLHGLAPTALGNADKVTTQQLIAACNNQLLRSAEIGTE